MFIVIGTVTTDFFVFGDASSVSQGSDGFRRENLIFTEKPMTLSMGGNGGISAYVLAGLGAPTALCGAVGQDVLGDTLVDWLQARDVDLTALYRSPTLATSCSTILFSDAASQVVYHHLGSTIQARYENIPPDFFTKADALLVSSFPIMPKLRAGGFAQVLARVHNSGGTTALDIGPAIGEPVTLSEITPLLPTVDYLIANTYELIALTGAPSWPRAAEQAIEAGAQRVIIKQGEQGASAWTPTDQITVPGYKVEANITAGAGDSFNVGFLYALQQGSSLEQALRFGNAVAALVVSSSQGVIGAPSLSEVESFLELHSGV